MFYLGPINVTETDFGTVTIATAGKTSVTVTLNTLTNSALDADGVSQIFFHYPTNSTAAPVLAEDGLAATTRLTDISYQGLGVTLQTALRAGATANSWTSPSGIAVTWMRSATPYGYRFAYPSAAFSVTFSNAAGRKLFGYSGNVSGTTTYDGDQTPTYAVKPTLDAVSEPTPNYEPGAVGNHIIADDGTGFGISRYAAPLYRDWTQQYETLEKTFLMNAASTHPWTLQHLFQTCRGERPFLVIDGFGESFYEAFSFRSEGVKWEAERASVGNASQFHVKFMTVVEGYLTAGL